MNPYLIIKYNKNPCTLQIPLHEKTEYHALPDMRLRKALEQTTELLFCFECDLGLDLLVLHASASYIGIVWCAMQILEDF
jgi:hypothetical protein